MVMDNDARALVQQLADSMKPLVSAIATGPRATSPDEALSIVVGNAALAAVVTAHDAAVAALAATQPSN